MDITASAGDILYMSIPYEPGWHMTADGEDVEVYRTDDGLIGITLLEGTHSYTLRFMPDYFVYSCILSAASLLLLIVIVLLTRYCKKRGVGFASLRGLAEAGADEALTTVERPADLPDLSGSVDDDVLGETDVQAHEILFSDRPAEAPEPEERADGTAPSETDGNDDAEKPE